jgi:hypothetical protein
MRRDQVIADFDKKGLWKPWRVSLNFANRLEFIGRGWTREKAYQKAVKEAKKFYLSGGW